MKREIQAAALASMLISAPAAADAPAKPGCDTAAKMAATLARGFAAKPIGVGLLMGKTPKWVLLVGPGSWHVVELQDDGTACLIAAGGPLPAPTLQPAE